MNNKKCSSVQHIPPIVDALVKILFTLPGVEGCLLGGSRASGTHNQFSDYDIGLYYSRDFLPQRIVQPVSQLFDYTISCTGLYEWGPRVNGGAWLHYEGVGIDILYRNIDDVKHSYENAVRGKVFFHYQLGHPLGVPDFAYVGELALGIPISISPELALLKDKAQLYPPELADSLVFHGLFDANFYVDIAKKALKIPDVSYISGCVFSAIQLTCHALHGKNHHWIINEKRALPSTATLSITVPHLEERFLETLPQAQDTIEVLEEKLNEAAHIIHDVMEAVDYKSIASSKIS